MELVFKVLIFNPANKLCMGACSVLDFNDSGITLTAQAEHALVGVSDFLIFAVLKNISTYEV